MHDPPHRSIRRDATTAPVRGHVAPTTEHRDGPSPTERLPRHLHRALALSRALLERVANVGAVVRRVPDPFLALPVDIPANRREHAPHLLSKRQHLRLHLFASAHLLQHERAPLLDEHSGHGLERVALLGAARPGRAPPIEPRRRLARHRRSGRCLRLPSRGAGGNGPRRGAALDGLLVERHHSRHRPIAFARVASRAAARRGSRFAGVRRARRLRLRLRVADVVGFVGVDARGARGGTCGGGWRGAGHVRGDAHHLDGEDARREPSVLEAHGARAPVVARELVGRLPLLVDAVVEVVEAQAAPGAVSRLEHLAPAQLGAEAEESALANHHEVRGGIGDGHGVLEGGGAEGDRLAGRVAIDDVRKAVHRERHHLARAETLRGGTRIGGILVTLAARVRVRSNPARASEERGRRLPGPTRVPRHRESVRATREGS